MIEKEVTKIESIMAKLCSAAEPMLEGETHFGSGERRVRVTMRRADWLLLISVLRQAKAAQADDELCALVRRMPVGSLLEHIRPDGDWVAGGGSLGLSMGDTPEEALRVALNTSTSTGRS